MEAHTLPASENAFSLHQPDLVHKLDQLSKPDDRISPKKWPDSCQENQPQEMRK